MPFPDKDNGKLVKIPMHMPIVTGYVKHIQYGSSHFEVMGWTGKTGGGGMAIPLPTPFNPHIILIRFMQYIVLGALEESSFCIFV